MKWYRLKNETLKESGKLFFDVFKIVVALAIITPMIKDGTANISPFIFAGACLGVGLYLINKGARDG